jgi:hypothetical protein
MLCEGVDKSLRDIVGGKRIKAGAPLPKRLLGHIVAELRPYGAWFDHRHTDPLKSQFLAESVMESDGCGQKVMFN